MPFVNSRVKNVKLCTLPKKNTIQKHVIFRTRAAIFFYANLNRVKGNNLSADNKQSTLAVLICIVDKRKLEQAKVRASEKYPS